jgi:hypothetical protein
VNILLIIVEKIILFSSEASWLKCYLKLVRRFRGLRDIVIVTPVDFLYKVKGIFEPSFLSALVSAIDS